ncbi:MAG TPA: MEDS domain-containing protein [bacterium]|nr:MEDS domain-containing protein [bacterium]
MAVTVKGGRHAFPEIAPGDHIIFIYEDASRLFAFVAPFIKKGLADGERCVYVAAESRPADVVEALSAGGVRVDQKKKRGAFALLTPREHFGLPAFDPVRTTERLRQELAEATSAGFTGLRVAAEMTWVGKAGVPEEALGEYEALLENVVGPGRATRACIYREDRFDPAVLERLVRTHGKVVADDYVYLSLSALFRSLARMDLQGLAQSAHERAARKGEPYFRQGDQATDVYFLTAGLVKLVRTDPDGRSVILRIIAPTEPFGDRVLALGGTVRLASAEALEDSRARPVRRPQDPPRRRHRGAALAPRSCRAGHHLAVYGQPDPCGVATPRHPRRAADADRRPRPGTPGRDRRIALRDGSGSGRTRCPTAPASATALR